MKRGFSFTTLAATVSAVLILITTVTISVNNTLNSQKKISFNSEISQIQKAVDSYKVKNGGNYPAGESILLDISNLNVENKNQFLSNNETIENNKIVLNEIDYSKLDIVSLQYGNKKEGDNDIYVVSPKTGKVYYAMGIKIDGKLYFCYTKELNNNNLTRSVFRKKISIRDAKYVVFEPSETKWTRDNVDIDIKLPLKYNLVNIMVNNEVYNNYSTTRSELYNVFTIKNKGAYNVTISYKKDENSRVYKDVYNVSNVDKNPPILKLKDEKIVLNNSNENIIGYINIIEKKDLESGIKKIKFEKNSPYSGNLTNEKKNKVKSHFEISGDDVLNDIIPIEKGVNNMVVYVEDNAGNWILKDLNI